MKSQLLSVLTVVGVLGTATAALAVNTDTLARFDGGVAGASSTAASEGTSLGTPSTTSPEATPAKPGAPVTVSADGSVSEGDVRQPVVQSSSRVAPGAPAAPASRVVPVAPVAPAAPVVAPSETAPVDATTGGSGSTAGADDGAGDYEESDDSSSEGNRSDDRSSENSESEDAEHDD
jgi:hypothetical protein